MALLTLDLRDGRARPPAGHQKAGAVLLRNVKVKAQTEKPLREEIVE
jgi:hypothetical protein